MPEPTGTGGRVVQRTFSDDELNIVILIYATPDGTRYLRKERAHQLHRRQGHVRRAPRLAGRPRY